jgi:hypothetical protein
VKEPHVGITVLGNTVIGQIGPECGPRRRNHFTPSLPVRQVMKMESVCMHMVTAYAVVR